MSDQTHDLFYYTFEVPYNSFHFVRLSICSLVALSTNLRKKSHLLCIFDDTWIYFIFICLVNQLENVWRVVVYLNWTFEFLLNSSGSVYRNLRLKNKHTKQKLLIQYKDIFWGKMLSNSPNIKSYVAVLLYYFVHYGNSAIHFLDIIFCSALGNSFQDIFNTRCSCSSFSMN